MYDTKKYKKTGKHKEVASQDKYKSLKGEINTLQNNYFAKLFIEQAQNSKYKNKKRNNTSEGLKKFVCC